MGSFDRGSFPGLLNTGYLNEQHCLSTYNDFRKVKTDDLFFLELEHV